MSGSPLSVTELEATEKIPWVAQIYLSRALRRGRTGVLLDANIRDPPRSMSPKWGIVWIKENGESLCARSKSERLPKFVGIGPGKHDLEFIVTRRGRGGISFSKEIELQPGQVLVALCEPIQPNVFYKKSPTADAWRIGIR